MTKATIYMKEENIVGFKIEGHSGYADIGQDIVCAAISTIAQATAKGITEVLCMCASEMCDSLSGYMKFYVEDDGTVRFSHAQTLLKTMMLTLTDIQWQYPDFLKVCTKEVEYDIM